MNNQSTPKAKKLLDQICDAILLKHYSHSTKKTYFHLAKRYILLHNKRHPAEMGALEVEVFLTHLANKGNVSSSTRNQALNAFRFRYRNIRHIDFPVRH